MSASGVNGVGDEAHESDGAAPVDQVYAPLHLQCTHTQNEAVRHTDTQTSTPVTENSSLFVCSSVVALNISVHASKTKCLRAWASKMVKIVYAFGQASEVMVS
jgi:hypothetical protein